MFSTRGQAVDVRAQGQALDVHAQGQALDVLHCFATKSKYSKYLSASASRSGTLFARARVRHRALSARWRQARHRG
eukprot:15543550-Heterocapsa_arctica.AAC.1